MNDVRSLWDDQEAAGFEGDLEQRVYTSRLLGRDRSLVLHGGGNTSVKLIEPDLFGEAVELLYVKGSGWDLDSIDAVGFSAVHLDALLRLANLHALTDTEMSRQLRSAMVDPSAPSPSVEAILHAVIPSRFVDHTHPDALLSVMNTPSGLSRITELYGDDVVVIPYVMPGFRLARECALELPRRTSARTIGVVLMHHGLVTFGDTARESYERTIDLVGRAERYLEEREAWARVDTSAPEPASTLRIDIAEMRRDVSSQAGRPMILALSKDVAAREFSARDDVERISTRGPATPDHVIRTKRVPLIGRDVETYAEEYRDSFQSYAASRSSDLRMLDPAPRVIIEPELGLLTAGADASEAAVVEEIYLHTIDVIERAERLERWSPLPERDILDVEYWELEQAKLGRGAPAIAFSGEVVLITGVASGIGRACVGAFLEAGAAVVGLDISDRVSEVSTEVAYLGIEGDVADEQAVVDALETGVRRFGGLDMLVLNAGRFPAGSPIRDVSIDDWRGVMQVNADANLVLLREALPLLRLAPNGGRVVVNASRNVTAPGPGAAPYSASKAALTQLARVAALEWGEHGIRVNVVHPDAVFDTGIWSEQVLARRAESYGVSVDEYRRSNVLRVEVTSDDVARMIVAMCGPAFARTTGAQVPVDGGNTRVI